MDDVPELRYRSTQKPWAGPAISLFVAAVGVAVLAERLPGWYAGAVFALDLAFLYVVSWVHGYELRISGGVLIWRATLRVRRVPLASVRGVRPAGGPGTGSQVVELIGARPMVVVGGPAFPRFAEGLRALLPGVAVIAAERTTVRDQRQRSSERLPFPRLLLIARALLAIESCAWVPLALWPDVVGCPTISVLAAILSPVGLVAVLGLGWWARRRPGRPVNWRHEAVLTARCCALLAAFAGLLVAVTDLAGWATGGCVAAWQTVVPFNAVLLAVNALIVPGLVLSRRSGPSSAAARPAAGAAVPST
jgi:hypothetical protein